MKKYTLEDLKELDNRYEKQSVASFILLLQEIQEEYGEDIRIMNLAAYNSIEYNNAEDALIFENGVANASCLIEELVTKIGKPMKVGKISTKTLLKVKHQYLEKYNVPGQKKEEYILGLKLCPPSEYNRNEKMNSKWKVVTT